MSGNLTVPAKSRATNLGEVIRATGPMAKVNPFRFSTKYQDGETELLYYGYRYCAPGMGKWLRGACFITATETTALAPGWYKRKQ
jgi:RHS repeat-associated protein